jgi:acyl carrier protein
VTADAATSPARPTVLPALVRILNEMTAEWDRDLPAAIGPGTWFIADLSFTSMDLVMLVVEIKSRWGCEDVPFEDLFAPGGRYVSDLRVGDMAAFLEPRL